MNELTPLVSVVVPVYKVEKYLPACIESILAQTYDNIEVILVDDGSPDNSGKICDEFAEKDSRIKVIHQKNGGVNVARKNGFSCSIGEWIMFVDSDDALTPNALEVLLSHSEGMDLVSGSVVIYRYGSNIPETFPKHIQEEGEYDGNVFLNQLFAAQRLCSLWRQLIRRSALSEDILSVSPSIRFSEDFIINLRIGMNLKHVRGVRDVVYEYYYYLNNTVTSFQMTSDYMDEYDAELLKSLSGEQKQLYSNQLYRYRLNTILDYIGVKNIYRTKMAGTLRRGSKNQKKPLKSGYGVLLLYIPSCKVRSVLFKTYRLLTKWIVKILGYGKM